MGERTVGEGPVFPITQGCSLRAFWRGIHNREVRRGEGALIQTGCVWGLLGLRRERRGVVLCPLPPGLGLRDSEQAREGRSGPQTFRISEEGRQQLTKVRFA